MMEEELFFSGYCRQTDSSRTVTVEEGEADCCYPDCPHSRDCTVAQSIQAALNEK